MTPAKRRYFLELAASMLILYPLAVWLSRWGQAQAGLPHAWRWVLALPPLVPCLWALAAIVRYTRSLDELQRRIQLEAATVSVALTALYLLSYGFLQDAMDWARPDAFAIFAVLVGSWGLGGFVGYWRYR